MWNELVIKAKSGHKKSMEDIINRLQPLILSLIKRYYNKPNEYEDLIQEGNLMILESIYDYDFNKSTHFLGFVKSNLKYLYLNKHKAKIHFSLNRTLDDEETELMDLLPSLDEDILDSLLQKEIALSLCKALKSLTSRQSQILILFYIENKSISYIADLLGISYRTVVNTKTNALKKIKKIISSKN